MKSWRHAIAAWLIIAACLEILDAPVWAAIGLSAGAVGFAYLTNVVLEILDGKIRRR